MIILWKRISQIVDNVAGVLQGPELDLKSDQLITVVPYVGREYNVSFELYLNKYQTEDWLSVLHFTTSGNSESYGDRNPAVWVGGHRDHHRQLHISSSIDGTTNMWIKSDKIYPLKTWIKIRISQALMYTQVFLLRNFTTQINWS